MTSGFAPSVHHVAKSGVRVVRGTYPPGVAGVRLSLEQIAQRIREGRLDPAVRGWAGDQLIAAGKPESIFKQAKVLLEAVRVHTVYVPDPVGAEYVASAAATLCLRPGLCIRASDCDDLTVVLGAALMSIGIPVQVIKQTFYGGDQEHVLIEAQDESGNWFPLDPSTGLPCGEKARASEEFRLDPSKPDMIGLRGAPEAEFVGIGSLPRLRPRPVRRGFGAAVTPYEAVITTGVFAKPSADVQNAIAAVITAGDSYMASGDYVSAIGEYQAAGHAGATVVGPEIDLAGAANVTQAYTQDAWNINGVLQAISATPTDTTTGITADATAQMVPSTQTVQANAQQAQVLAKQMLGLYQLALIRGQSAMAATPAGRAPATPGSMALGTGQAAALTLALGVVGGLGWAWWRSR